MSDEGCQSQCECLSVDLSVLIGKYGYAAILNVLNENMRSTYEFLRIYYGDVSGAQVSSQVSSQVSGNLIPEKKKIRKVKGSQPPASEQLFKTDISGNSSVHLNSSPPPPPPETPLQSSGQQIPSSSENTMVASSIQEKLETSGDQKKVQVIPSDKKHYLSREEEKEKKKEHDLKVKLKREELISKSVVPEQLLTKEKMEDWINKGWTYWKIAEETGCPDTIVSGIAKGYGLKRLSSNNVYVKRIA